MGFGLGLSGSKSKGSSKTDSTSTSYTGLPEDAINAIKGDAKGIYDKLKAQGYTEKEIAGLNDQQLAAIGKLDQSGHLQDVMNQTQGGIDKLLENANTLTGVGGGSKDQTVKGTTQGALDFVNSDFLKGQTDAIDKSAATSVDQANKLINRNLQESTLPSIYRQGVGEGNVGSSRSAIAQGVAARGAMEQSANTAENILNAANQQKTGLTNQAYQQGLQVQQNMANQNIQNQLAGLGMGNQTINQALGQLGQKGAAGQQSILNQLMGGNLQQQNTQAGMDNQYMNTMQKQLKDAGVTDMNTFLDLLNKMNPLMNKTNTGSSSTSSKQSTIGAQGQMGMG